MTSTARTSATTDPHSTESELSSIPMTTAMAKMRRMPAMMKTDHATSVLVMTEKRRSTARTSTPSSAVFFPFSERLHLTTKRKGTHTRAFQSAPFSEQVGKSEGGCARLRPAQRREQRLRAGSNRPMLGVECRGAIDGARFRT